MAQRKVKKVIGHKLRSRSGESFAELLAASAIISLAAVMLLSMVTASAHMVTRTEKKYHLYYQCMNGYEKKIPQTYEEENITTKVTLSEGSTATISGDGVNETVTCTAVTSTSEDDAGSTYTISGYIAGDTGNADE